MRAFVCVLMLVSLCAISVGRQAAVSEKPAQVTLQPGQQLFPSVAPDKTIAYSQRNGADWDIYVLRHASSPINLTADSAADDWQAEFSPDGKLLVFRSERNAGGIYIMNPDGKNVKRLTNAGFNPNWSPDGSEIVYSTAQVIADPTIRPVRGTLFAIRVATGERRTVFAMGDAVQPRWSPNGRRIAFWGFASQGGQRDIWTINSAGSDPIKVTDDAATDWNPVWSPDGKYLYYGSDRDGKMEIWRSPVDQNTGQVQGPPTQITKGGYGTRGHIAFDFAEVGFRMLYIDDIVNQMVDKVGFDPASGRVTGQQTHVLDPSLLPSQLDVSPSGDALAFYSGIQQENLYTAKVDGTNVRQLTNDQFRDRGPAWSPDGKRIAFYSDRSGTYEIWTINVDGSGLRQITNTPAANRSGALWSPDGSRLAYVQRRGPTWDTYVIDPGKSPSEQVLQELPAIGAANEYFTATSWSPDGQKLVGNRSFTDRVAAGGIFTYSLESNVFQMIVDKAVGARWLNDSRRLIYSDPATNKIFLVDTLSPVPVEILSVAPRSLGPIRLAPDNKSIYLTLSTSESHVWEVDIPPGT
jgi:Tol biopolymer transport system component